MHAFAFGLTANQPIIVLDLIIGSTKHEFALVILKAKSRHRVAMLEWIDPLV